MMMMMMIYSKLVARWQQRPASSVATRGRKIDTGLFRFRLSHHLIFYSVKTVIKRNCVQSSYTYRYNKMLWRQIVNIGSYKTQLSVQSSYTYTYSKMLWRQMCRHISVISTAKYQLTRTWRGSICEGDACWQVVSPGGASTGTRLVRWR